VKSRFQSLLLDIYRRTVATGALRTSWGRNVFLYGYHVYKRYYEARHTDLLRTVVNPSGYVIDVGANVGFFTIKFARWVANDGLVLAIEPETQNCRDLERAVQKSGLAEKVSILQAAVSRTSGAGYLYIDPGHPGNHRLATTGSPVQIISIDSLLETRGRPEVSLIKIDVQGAEEDVIRGATSTIRRFYPSLYVEIDDLALRQFGSSAAQVMTLLVELGYSIHKLTSRSISQPIPPQEALQLVQSGKYTDFLFGYQLCLTSR
jgi:FkbM family methyltransferase